MQLKNMLQFKMSWARPTGPHNDVVLSSRIRLARNLEGRRFPPTADADSARAVLDSVFAAAAAHPPLAKAARIELDTVEPIDRFFLVERHLISNRLASSPQRRGVVVGDQEILSIMVNEEDHMRLQGIDSGLCLPELHQTVDALDDDLSARLKIAYDKKWGYLTSCPTNAGTGLRASCLVHLPGLGMTGQINPLLASLKKIGITARGLYGEGTQVMGDFYQLSNNVTLGPSEKGIIGGITKMVKSLIRKETEARASLSSGGRKLRLEDLVYRSLGILTQARSISFEETLRHLSFLRMGLSLGWKMPADMRVVNELFVLVQPIHIQVLAGKALDPTDQDFLRATLLRRRIK
ncbi:MAG: protein arginine kinase [Elusimicrobiota bacterium]